jgi:glycosyltransferase involved in cell wall biosynthesis
MVRVCHFTSAHPSEDIRIFHKECSSLAKKGFSVSLIAVDCIEKRINDVQIISVQSAGKGRFNRMLKTTRLVYLKALELDADIYHFHDPELLPYALKLKRKGKKVIYDVHEDVPKQIMDKHWIPKLFRSLISYFFASYENYVAKRLSGIISVTSKICDRFGKVNANVELVANFPLLEETKHIQESTIQKQPRQICYIGGLFPTRGVKELIEAIEKIDVKLVLAGTFSPIKFEEEMKQLPGWEKVEFLGHVNRQKIMEILKSSHLGVVTLHPTRSYIEALPIKMFEYMSAGIPVVASDFPLWREIIDEAECGICVDPMNIQAISKEIEFLLDNPDIAEKMGRNGEEAYKSKYNWSVEEGKLVNFYSKLLV